MRRALVAAVAAVAAGALTCPGGHTSCPSGDACCVGVAPDAYAVEGGYGCMPPGTANYTGCAGGGTFPDGCCCAPGPSAVDATGLCCILNGVDGIDFKYTDPCFCNVEDIMPRSQGRPIWTSC